MCHEFSSLRVKIACQYSLSPEFLHFETCHHSPQPSPLGKGDRGREIDARNITSQSRMLVASRKDVETPETELPMQSIGKSQNRKPLPPALLWQTTVTGSEKAFTHVIDRVGENVTETIKESTQECFEKAAMLLCRLHLDHRVGLCRVVNLLEEYFGGGP